MKGSKLTAATEDRAAIAPAKRFAKSAPQLAFVAAIAAYGASGAAGASTVPAAPTAAPSSGVQFDFRCFDNGEGETCSVETLAGEGTFERAPGTQKVLEFSQGFSVCEGESFVRPTGQGVGLLCDESVYRKPISGGCDPGDSLEFIDGAEYCRIGGGGFPEVPGGSEFCYADQEFEPGFGEANDECLPIDTGVANSFCRDDQFVISDTAFGSGFYGQTCGIIGSGSGDGSCYAEQTFVGVETDGPFIEACEPSNFFPYDECGPDQEEFFLFGEVRYCSLIGEPSPLGNGGGFGGLNGGDFGGPNGGFDGEFPITFANGGGNGGGDEGPDLDAIAVGERLIVESCDGDNVCFDPTTAFNTTGIYISGVTAHTVGEGPGRVCESDNGEVFVWHNLGDSEGGTRYFWSAPAEALPDGGEECLIEGEQTVFLPFLFTRFDFGTESVVLETGGVAAERIDLEVFETAEGSDGVFLLGTEDCNGGELTPEGRCEVPLLTPDEGFGSDFRVLATSEAPLEVVQDFPIRIEDPREICRPNPSTSAPYVDLVLDSSVTAWANEGTPSAPNIVSASGVLPLLVADGQAPGPLVVETFSVSAKACGVPRANDANGADPAGAIVDRNGTSTDWTPFIDVIAITADFDPIADTTEILSGDLDFITGTSGPASPYACQNTLTAGFEEDQPFIEINALPDEIKYVQGPSATAPTLDPVGRDIMVGCGTTRGLARRWSLVTFNVIHAPGTDFRAETSDEVTTLLDTIARVSTCLNPDLALTLQRRAASLSRNFTLYERLITRARFARIYFDRAERDLAALENDVRSNQANFGTCFSDASTGFVAVTADPSGDNKELNAFGDILSQVQHLRYVFDAFQAKLRP